MSPLLADLLVRMLFEDPAYRPSANGVIRHQFIRKHSCYVTPVALAVSFERKADTRPLDGHADITGEQRYEALETIRFVNTTNGGHSAILFKALAVFDAVLQISAVPLLPTSLDGLALGSWYVAIASTLLNTSY